MKKFSIIHVPILSFFSGDLYRDVGLNWRGVCFGYLFLLVAACAIPRVFIAKKSISLFIDEKAPPLVDQVPKITITDGEVHVSETQPYYIIAPDSNEVLVVIDTTGTIQSLDDTDAFVLLTKTKLILRESKVEHRTYDLSKVKEFTLERGKIMDWLNIGKKLIVPILLPFIIVGSYIFRIIQALIYAAIGLIFANFCRVRLSYDALIRLAVVAVTPCIIVRTIFAITSVYVPMAGLWFFLLAMGYLFIGVKASSQPVELSPEDNIFPGGERPFE